MRQNKLVVIFTEGPAVTEPTKSVHTETQKGWFLCPRKILEATESQKLERLNVRHHTSIDLAQRLSLVQCNWIWRGQKEPDAAERQDWDSGDDYSQSRQISVEITEKGALSDLTCVLLLTLEMWKLQLYPQHVRPNELSPHWFRCNLNVQKQYLSSDPFNH